MSNETIDLRASSGYADALMQPSGRDPFIVNGSLLFLDFLNPLCNPNADGALAANASFVNMVDGGIVPTITAAGAFTNRAGKLGLESTGAAGFLQTPIGSMNFRQAAAPDHALLVLLWRKVITAGMTTASYTNIMKLAPAAGANAVTSQFSFDSGLNGTVIRRQVGTGAATTNNQDAALLDTIELIGMHFDPVTGKHSMIHNAACNEGDSGVALPFRYQDGAAAYFRLNGGYKQCNFILLVEDLTLSGSTPAEVVAAEYAYRLPLLTAAGV